MQCYIYRKLLYLLWIQPGGIKKLSGRIFEKHRPLLAGGRPATQICNPRHAELNSNGR